MPAIVTQSRQVGNGSDLLQKISFASYAFHLVISFPIVEVRTVGNAKADITSHFAGSTTSLRLAASGKGRLSGTQEELPIKLQEAQRNVSQQCWYPSLR